MPLPSLQSVLLPIFITHGRGVKRPIPSLPGHHLFSIDKVYAELRRIERAGIGGVILYGIPSVRDATASNAFGPRAIVQRAIKEIKKRRFKLRIIADLCVCQYTDHGHCRLVRNGTADDALTRETLVRLGHELIDAGADSLMPSAMLSGVVSTLRGSSTGRSIHIINQAGKFASALYSPFRAAAGVTLESGALLTKDSYQLSPFNREEAIQELNYAADEGADLVMVKPALFYLDVVAEARRQLSIPLGVFETSGEYGMIVASAPTTELLRASVCEHFFSYARAGASFISSYFALEYGDALKAG